MFSILIGFSLEYQVKIEIGSLKQICFGQKNRPINKRSDMIKKLKVGVLIYGLRQNI